MKALLGHRVESVRGFRLVGQEAWWSGSGSEPGEEEGREAGVVATGALLSLRSTVWRHQYSRIVVL